MTRVVGKIGRADFGPPDWVITADPDVMIRLKRLIPGVRIQAAVSLCVSDTDANARELEWVLSRWTFTMSAEDRAYLARRADADRAREDLVADVMTGTATMLPGPGWLESKLPLRDYQRLATDLVRATGHTLIVDELGLGKTLTSLALLEDPNARPALAVTLTGLGRQWRRELAKFYPDLTAVEVKTTKAVDELPRYLTDEGDLAYDLILVNYAKLWAWAPVLAGKVRTVIFDEIQELRRADSLKYEAGQHIAASADYVTGLSATPVYNYGGEMFSVMNIISPGCLGSRDEFLREYSGSAHYQDSNGKIRIKNPDGLRSLLTSHGLFLRRTREDVGISLPAIETIEQVVPSDRKTFDELSGNAIEMARLILAEDTKSSQRWQSAGELDWRLRQATGISKAPFIAEFVRLVLESQDKVVLFGWHRAVYDIWTERLAPFNPVLYTGTESPAAKANAFERFVHGDARVLIMSLRSGAGLDGLQDVCSTLVFGELDWSPGVHRQAIGRLGRPGQERGVLAYFCVSTDGSDPVILDTLNIKAMESDRLIEPDHNTGTATPVAKPDHIKRLAESVLANTQPQEVA